MSQNDLPWSGPCRFVLPLREAAPHFACRNARSAEAEGVGSAATSDDGNADLRFDTSTDLGTGFLPFFSRVGPWKSLVTSPDVGCHVLQSSGLQHALVQRLQPTLLCARVNVDSELAGSTGTTATFLLLLSCQTFFCCWFEVAIGLVLVP
jgi:hypothetical protein